MGSYEEWVVDRSVDAAWLTFRVRLADHLVDMDEGDVVRLGVAGVDDHAVTVLFRATGGGHVQVTWAWVDEVTARKTVHVGTRKVDSYLTRVQRDLMAAGAQHPCFVEVLEGNVGLVDAPSVLVGPSAQSPAVLPESVMPGSHEELVELVRLTVAERLGHDPRISSDGSIGMSRGSDVVRVRVSRSRRIVEVWAEVARDVDVRRARKVVAKLGAGFHFFSFSLQGDRVYVSASVNAGPFSPAHLDRAIESTFTFLQREAPKVSGKVARRQAKDVPEAESVVDPDLLLVFGAAGDRSAMVELARGLAGDSRTTLGQWRRAAKASAAKARIQAGEGQHGPVQNALIDQVIAWRSVADALTEAVSAIVAEQGA